MKKYWIISLIILSSCSSDDDSNRETSNQFYKGMDLSFQSELENYNIDYKDEDGNSVELLDFVRSKGTNLVRLKLWHTPQDGQNGLEDVKTYAQKIKAQNMDFLLNFYGVREECPSHNNILKTIAIKVSSCHIMSILAK